MTCLDCGHALTEHRENFRFEICGLPGVTLNDTMISRCAHCGCYEVATPQLASLHGVIALAVIRKRPRLTPAEVRYLRKWLRWTGRNCANHLGATPETVSRWENGKVPIGVQADRLLRLMVAHEKKLPFSLDELKEVATEPAADLRLRLRFDEAHDAWEVVPDERRGSASRNPALAPVPKREPLGTEDTASGP